MTETAITLAALGSAVGFASGQIAVRIGLGHSTPTTAVAFSLSTSVAILCLTLGPLIAWENVATRGLLLFLSIGALSPFCTQILLFVSALKVGISRASPLRNTTPLFAGLLAVFFLGESWTHPIIAGTVLIVLGATLLGMKDSGASQSYRRIYLLLPLLAAILGGLSSPLRKYGFSLVPSVPLAICAVQLGAFLALIVYLTAGRKYKELIFGPGTVTWFGLSGLCNSVAVALNMLALEQGSVVIVSPLVSTVPLFTVALSAMFLRSFERVTLKIVLGAASICLGGIVLTVLR